ncbi:hypothetical protein R50345_22705 [Paenibacillus sp. FSL R5-0345]|nr:hypothetical protein R50345_22705 [Paenibacillus sp. FSL R5-0345]
MKNTKEGLPEALTVTLRQLVMNGHYSMAGIVLYVYFIRCWKLEDELAAYYVPRYFAKYFPNHLVKYQRQTAQLQQNNFKKGT